MTDQTPSGIAMKPVTAAKKLGIYLPATPQEFQDGAVTHAELRELQDKYGLTYLFISHDLAVVRAMAHDMIVVKDGKVVERGASHEVFESPQHPYTKELLAAAHIPL